MSLIPTPSQTVGPYFSLGMAWLTTTDLAKDASAGERIVVAGCVWDGDGKPIPDSVLEVWQANASGKYTHPDDPQDTPIDPGFTGFGRIPTDTEGRFRFVTIKPGATPGSDNTLQAPHIAVTLFMRGLGRQLTTRIYFSDEPANGEDPILGRIEEPARRETLIARRIPGTNEYRWDIHMQGDFETVFFDC